MADVANPPAALSASKNGAITADKSQKPRPEKPDEQLYKDSLAKAESEYTAAQEKVVRVTPIMQNYLPNSISRKLIQLFHPHSALTYR